MGETDPFACLCIPAPTRPGGAGGTLGSASGRRVRVVLSYLTPRAHWHTIWRTLANPGE